MTKKNHKYIGKIPKPGGGYYYIYPEDVAAKAKNTAKTIKKEFNNKLPSGLKVKAAKAKTKYKIANSRIGDTIGIDDRMRYETAKKYGTKLDQRIQKKRYDKSPMGKISKFAENSLDDIGDSAKAAGKKLKKSVKKAKKKISKVLNRR